MTSTLETHRTAILQRLSEHGIRDATVKVADDPYGGWRLLVVSDGFAGLGPSQRRDLVFRPEDRLGLQWYDLVTPEEYDPTTESHLLSKAGDLPLWPNVLAASERSSPLHLPSDSDDRIPPPFIVTFFSLRGGVGRSTALAMAARSLARQGDRVLCIDMDLEAPGLASLFRLEDQLSPDRGTVALLTQLDTGQNPELTDHLIRISEAGEFYCLPAGLPSPDYARRLAQIDPQAWYEEERNPFRLLFDLVSNARLNFDVVLVDARTGISPLNAPLLFDISDMVTVVFFPHPQSITGTASLTKALFSAHTRRPDREYAPEPRFLISPIPPVRTPGTEGYWEQRGKDLIGEWLLVANRRRQSTNLPQIDVEDVTHVVLYNEAIANSEALLEDSGVHVAAYEPVADWIHGFTLPRPSATQEVPRGPSKEAVLASIEFSTGMAEAEERESFLETFLSTALVEKALEPRVPLVLGRKGSGKSALFRYLQLTSDDSIVGLSPRGVRRESWLPDAPAFAAVERVLNKGRLPWSTYWLFHVGMVTVAKLERDGADFPRLPGLESMSWNVEGSSRLDVVRMFEAGAGVQDAQLAISDWVDRGVRLLTHPVTILFDGLDTEFGLGDEERRRRSNAVSELLRVVDLLASQPSVRFKVLLRHDIWRGLTLPNKSHYFGRAVTLAWDDQIEYLKVVLKQAVRFAGFLEFATGRLPEAPRALLVGGVRVDDWSEDAALLLWRILVGQRMAGGNTAFTYNWVWNRLADGTGSHGPRSLIQLFHLAKVREQVLHRANAYSSSLIRPRALSDSLDSVSEEGLGALREEFPELDSLFQRLRAVGRTPFGVADFGEERDLELEGLAIEVGLLSANVDAPNEVERYRVPELYRRALGMTRRGQV